MYSISHLEETSAKYCKPKPSSCQWEPEGSSQCSEVQLIFVFQRDKDLALLLLRKKKKDKPDPSKVFK